MEITAKDVMKLRSMTGAGMMDCKEALKANDGEIDASVDYLRKKGITKAAKKSERAANEGQVASFLIDDKSRGCLVEVNCETDFVARTPDFQNFVKDITMHIAASDPRYIRREDVGQEAIEQEREIIESEFANKPAQVIEKIANGRLEKFYAENCLLEQPFVKDEDINVREYVASCVAKLGENLRVRRFVRFQLGEEV
ncbi:translation elongation factor Ts [bacterium]|nr:translation elongation factor Ts [bacterium]